MLPARILLIHGALADGSSWSKVISPLLAAGHNVTAVQQPLTSLGDDITAVKQTLETLNNESSAPIVVAAHSFGGFVMTNAVTDVPNIKALVYVHAFAPDEGESVASLDANYTALESAEHFIQDSAGRLYLSQQDYLRYFAPDVEPEHAKVLAAVQGPFDSGRFDFVSGKPAWKQINHISYVIAENDQIIQPEMQRFFSKRLGAKTYELRGSSHAGLYSRAKEVADIILTAARSC